jgi:DNA-binding NarL/FixJ family response regulator
MPLRVIVADDDYLVRDGITALLRELIDVDVVGTASSVDALFAAVEEHHPDVVLTDIRMPPRWDDEGIEAARRIRREHPGIGVVVLSQHAEAAYAMALLEKGVDGVGYLLKERVGDAADLVNALTTVAAGGSVIDPKVVQERSRASSSGRSSPTRRGSASSCSDRGPPAPGGRGGSHRLRTDCSTRSSRAPVSPWRTCSCGPP